MQTVSTSFSEPWWSILFFCVGARSFKWFLASNMFYCFLFTYLLSSIFSFRYRRLQVADWFGRKQIQWTRLGVQRLQLVQEGRWPRLLRKGSNAETIWRGLVHSSAWTDRQPCHHRLWCPHHSENRLILFTDGKFLLKSRLLLPSKAFILVLSLASVLIWSVRVNIWSKWAFYSNV